MKNNIITKKHKLFTVLFTLSALLIVFLGGCDNTPAQSAQTEPIRRTNLIIGTVVDIAVFDKKDEKTLDDAMLKISAYDKIFNSHIEDSEVSAFNQLKENTPFQLSDDLDSAIKTSLKYAQASNGLLDISIYPVSHLWQFSSDNPHVPDKQTLDNALLSVGYQHIIYDESAKTIQKTDANSGIDLGSVAKGYIADKLAAYFEEQGVKHALINLGGNVYAVGTKPDGSDWTIGIQKPFDPTGTVLGTIKAADKAIVTSGIYERQFIEDDIAYHHILDPKTGYPMNNELTGVSIISSSATNADALSTTVFMLGVEKGLDFIENTPDTEAIFILKDNTIMLSSGIINNFKCIDKTYTVISQ